MNFERLRHHKQITTEETAKARTREHNRANGRWPFYESSIFSYFSNEDDEAHISFFGLETITDLRERIKDIKGSGLVMGVDVMGQGEPCKQIGCDVVFASTLDNKDDDAGLNIIVDSAIDRGVDLDTFDLFDSRALQEFLTKVQSQTEIPLGVVFFRPYGGLEQYFYRKGEREAFDNDYVAAYLYRELFTPLYEQLASKGVMFLELNGLPNKYLKYFIHLLQRGGISVNQKRNTNVLKIEKISDDLLGTLPELTISDLELFTANMIKNSQ